MTSNERYEERDIQGDLHIVLQTLSIVMFERGISKSPLFTYALQPATIWRRNSGGRQKEQSEVTERLYKWRFCLVPSVILRYLMVKLKMFPGSFLCVLDHGEFSF